ncbi:MAG TPA: DUF1553 domain-containing protein [Phycisphaerae bacterium]|nr:DUF1553 domain-containing protein [Phycisphaerae bacterium]
MPIGNRICTGVGLACAALVGASLLLADEVPDQRVPDFTYSRPQGPPKILPALPHERPKPPEIRFGVFKPFNAIDHFVLKELQERKIKPAGICDDGDFARRSSLDLVGVIPTATDLKRYLAWPQKERRTKWVDFLLAQSQYADHWTIFWGDLLREQGRVPGTPPDSLKGFLRQCLTENRPYDEWVRELITASGPSDENPATAFILRDRADPDFLTISITQGFMGIQLKCAQCHDHPFDWWTHRQFKDMNGFWLGTRPRFYRMETMETRRGTMDRPLLGVESRERRAAGVFVTGATSEKGEGRDGLADLLTRRDNPFFARVTVNRLWDKLMGIGLVNPVDNFSALNPASHPKLLDWLALEFIDSGYDLKHILRLIATSRTYQQTTRRDIKRLPPPRKVGPSDDQNEVVPGALYECMLLRRMSAEQIHDSILAATGRYFGDRRFFQPAIEKSNPPPPRDFLRIFGSTDRDTLLPRPQTPTIQQSLTMLNGDFLNQAVRIHPEHPIRYWERQGMSAADCVDALFLQILTRPPTGDERRWALSYIGEGTREWAWEDLQWALFNTREFQFIR